MSVTVSFSCTGCSKHLSTSCPLRAGGMWPKSYRWACRGCPNGRQYMLHLKGKTMCYSISSVDSSWRRLSDNPAFDVTFYTTASQMESGTQVVSMALPTEAFLQAHSLQINALLSALLLQLEPIDEARAAQLSAELTASTNHGALADRATIGFADAGARSGYVRSNLSSRSKQIGLLALLEPAVLSLLNDRNTLRVVSFGGGPGECALALALCRSVLRRQLVMNFEVAVLDLEEGWRGCVEHLACEMKSNALLTPADQMWFGLADVTRALCDPANVAATPPDQWDLVVFSYVLVENSKALHEGAYALLRELFCGLHPGACVVILDSSLRLGAELQALAQEYGLRASFPRPERGPGRIQLTNSLVLTKPLETSAS